MKTYDNKTIKLSEIVNLDARKSQTNKGYEVCAYMADGSFIVIKRYFKSLGYARRYMKDLCYIDDFERGNLNVDCH